MTQTMLNRNDTFNALSARALEIAAGSWSVANSTAISAKIAPTPSKIEAYRRAGAVEAHPANSSGGDARAYLAFTRHNFVFLVHVPVVDAAQIALKSIDSAIEDFTVHLNSEPDNDLLAVSEQIAARLNESGTKWSQETINQIADEWSLYRD